MGLVGRYIDALNDEQRDRIIEGQGWVTGSYYQFRDGSRCLLGHARGLEFERNFWAPRRKVSDDVTADIEMGCLWWNVEVRFDMLCDRFGLNRVVRACKLRAAERNRIALPEPTTVVS